MRSGGRPSRIVLAALLLLMPLAMLTMAPGLVSVARAQGENPLAQGTELYNQGNFQEAANLLRTALGSNQVPGPDQEAARELLARSLAKAGSRGEAREVFVEMLKRDDAYRADPNRVPPDEVAVFNEALREFQAWQLEQGQRIPASVGCNFGYGMYNPSDINDAIKLFDEDIGSGGAEEIKGGVEFGGSVRFPLRPRLSLDLEIMSFQSTVSDSGRPSIEFIDPSEFEITALPVVVSLYYTAWSTSRIRANLFAGLGPMMVTDLTVTLNYQLAPQLPSFAKTGTKTGFYGHLGIEGEYMITPRFALSGRVLGRMASAGKVISYDTKGVDEWFARFNDKSVNFSGLGFDVGLRAYIGS